MRNFGLLQRLICNCSLAATLTAGIGMVSPVALAQAAPGQTTYATPSEAASALVAACRSGNEDELLKVLGPSAKDLISSGDPVADKKSRDGFIKSYTTKHSIKPEAQGIVTLVIGTNDYPMPIPIVRDGLRWYFDSARGSEEILNRRIGENELGAIAVCEGYVAAQKEYAARGHDGLPKGIYAQKLVSAEGKHDGLYWAQVPGKPMSPMGPAVAQASAEGYTGAQEPYHGYLYRLLKEQGPNADGGARSYLVDGKLSGGFALLAYPANYGVSGVMTFLVNQNGNILQKDLGDNTEATAKAMTAYDPDDSWVPAQ